MKIDFIRTFIQLTEVKSFSKLAGELGISQSTLSHRISQLEDDFGEVKLINRTTRKFELTEAGEFFLKNAQKIVELYDSSKAELSRYSDISTEDIIITASTLPGSHILPKYIAQFRQDNPRANFKILINNSNQSLKLLMANQAIFAGIGSFMGYKEENLDIIKIGEENLKFVCGIHHVLSEKDIVSFKELVKFPFINRERGSGTRNIFEGKFPKHSELDSILEMDDNNSIISAISESNYISIFSEIIAQKAVDAGLIKILEIKEHPIITNRDLYFIKRKDKKLSPLQKKFWNSLM